MRTKLISFLAATTLLLGASPALAQSVEANVAAAVNARVGSTTIRGSAEVSMETRIQNARQRADQEIDRRIAMLSALSERVQGMTRVSATTKAAVADAVGAEISSLQSLRAKIDADQDIEALRADIQSIAQSYRIFVLVIPQGRIEVAADKILTTADSFEEFAAKLDTRIAALQTSGNDVTRLSTLLADMNAKIDDARTLANAAIELVADLKPDGGDRTAQEANASAMREARAKIDAALKDLQTARTDAGSIVTGLKEKGSASAEASTSTEVE